MAAIQAVIFDMDGLMLDSEAIYQLAWQAAAADQGFVLSAEDYAEFLGRTIDVAEPMLAERYGPTFDIVAFNRNWDTRWHQYVEQHGIPRKPGLERLLDLLHADGYRKGVATSTHRPEAMLSLGVLASRFDAITSGDEVVHGKPAPDIFLLAAQRLGAAPDACLVLEDSEAGIAAAHAAGMRVICVPDLKQPAPDVARLATAIYDSLDDVRHWLVTQAAQAQVDE